MPTGRPKLAVGLVGLTVVGLGIKSCPRPRAEGIWAEIPKVLSRPECMRVGNAATFS